MSDIQLPASTEAERAVLGAILLNREAIIAVADTLKPEHFYMERHAHIYAAALNCYHQRIPPDTRTVSEELRRRGQLDLVGGIMYLGELVDSTPTSAHIGFYAIDVLKTAMRRRLLSAISHLGALIYNETEDVAAIVERAHELIDGASIALHDPRYRPFSAAALDLEELPPVRWAIPELLPQGLTLLIGKPKMRKSWLALGIGVAVASGGRALGSIPVEQGEVLYLALEDSKRRLQSRQRKILCGGAAPEQLYYMTTAPRLDEGLIGMVEGWLRRHADARLIIVDVLAMVRPRLSGRGSMYDEDYAHIKPLQELAHRHDVAILVVHHMNRSDAQDSYDLINGSNGVGGASDGLLTLQYERGQTDATLTVSNRDLQDDSDLAVRWDTTIAQWILLGKAEEVRTSNERQEITRLLREEKRPLGPREVMDLLGKVGEYTRIKQLMYRMSKDGDLQITGRGMYTLPSLTLLDPGESNAESNEVIGGDPSPITKRSCSQSGQNDESNAGDRDRHSKKQDHLRYLVTLEGSEASGSHEKGNAPESDEDHHRYLFDDEPEPPPAAGLPPIDWPYVRAQYAAGNEHAIRTHCAMRREDPDRVLRALRNEDAS